MPSDTKVTRVFISYAHEPDDLSFGDQVLALADRLRQDGIAAVIDQYEPGPPEGWPLWMDRQIREADYVLMVCTRRYHDRVTNQEEGQGASGARWEGQLIYNALYREGAVTSKFIPLLVRSEDRPFIPTPLAGQTYYYLPAGYDDLYRVLTHQPSVPPPDVGERRVLPPRAGRSRPSPGAAVGNAGATATTPVTAPPAPAPRSNLPQPPAGYAEQRHELLDMLKDRLTGTRLLTLYGETGSGKSPLAVLLGVDALDDTRRHPDGVWLVDLSRAADPTLHQSFEVRIAAVLGSVFQHHGLAVPSGDTLVTALAPINALLILDNAARVDRDRCAMLITDLLERCPGIRIIWCGTEPLSVRGEQSVFIPRLLSTRELLYAGDGLLGWLMSMQPLHFFLLSTASACLFLLIPAYMARVHWIPPETGYQGFWQKPNWSFAYTILLPSIFTGTVFLSHRIGQVVSILCSQAQEVIANERLEGAWDYPIALSQALARHSRPTIVTCALIAFAFTAGSTQNLWTGIVRGEKFFDNRITKPDWDNAWNPRIVARTGTVARTWKQPTKGANVAFDVLAYTAQTWIFFLGLFWLTKLARFFIEIAEVLSRKSVRYRFKPLIDDPKKRLGLGGMGLIFDGFLGLIILFEGFVFYHRLQIIGQLREKPFGAYLDSVIQTLRHPPSASEFLTPSFLIQFFGLDAIDAGERIGIFCLAIPLSILAYLPLCKIRHIIQQHRDDNYEEYARAYADAKARSDREKAKEYRERLNELSDAEVWPNGDSAASRGLLMASALALGSLLPPVLVVLVPPSAVYLIATLIPKAFFAGSRRHDSTGGADDDND